MTPSPGRIVQYTLSEQDAEAINRRRHDAQKAVQEGTVGNTGFVLHVGNDVSEGDTFPMMIVRCWGSDENASVNGQVFLDGNDSFWACSRSQGDGPFKWREFPRV